ncbi:hypothetical protein H5J22_02375 [Cetobacterium sp. 8H]|uniref:hypothetical protein n=1 Tax=Cetobacterium sp. 8H TaxID=2759681 RepID=UPI00163B952A|nr:hypothetical protein [Cetobacterium sp. 8H]MBC2850288.1 hypothetical protein [Cetobacterium sp. 8H]
MSRTIRVFRPIVKYQGGVINFNFDDFLGRIFNNTRENNLRLVNLYPIILKRHPHEFNVMDYVGGVFWKYRRNYKPYTGELNIDTIAQIDGTVVETTNFIYDRAINCIALEFNREGILEKDFIRYIETFLPQDYSLELSKVYEQITLDEVLNSNRVRSLEIKLNLNSVEENILRENFQEERNGFVDWFNGVVNASQNTGDNLGANFAYWRFDLGRGRGTFDLETFRTLAETLNLESEKIESVKVKFDGNNEKLKECDLKNIGKQYSFKILENSDIENPGSEYIIDTLQQVFDQNHRMNLMGNLGRDNGVQHDFNFNNLNYAPLDHNFVEID